MKILVCISNVPDTTTKITFTDNNTQFNTNGVQFILNPYDEIALARIYAGFHYRNSTEVGRAMGQKIGEYVVANALQPM